MIGPVLLGYNDTDYDVKEGRDTEKSEIDFKTWQSLPRHRDEDQVRLDVDRSFIWYPYGMSQCLRCPSTRLTCPRTKRTTIARAQTRTIRLDHRSPPS